MSSPSSEPLPYSELIPRPDPSKLTDEAISRATGQYRRELESMQGVLETRMAGMDTDRARLWERIRELPGQYEQATVHFREEVARRDAAGRELIEQRLADLDKARSLTARVLENLPEEARLARERMAVDFTRQMTSEREFILAQLSTVQAVTVEKFVAVDGQFSASKIAVDAALSAAKEAVTEQNKANSAAIKVSEANTKEQLTSLGQVSSANFKAQEDKIADARDRLTALESRTAGIQQGTSAQRDNRREELAERGFTHNAIVTVFIGLSLLVSISSILLAAFKK